MAEANPPPELGNRGYFFSWYPLPDGGWAVLPAHTPPPGSITIPPGTEPVPPPWSGAQPPLGYWGAGGGFPTNPIQLPPWAGGWQPYPDQGLPLFPFHPIVVPPGGVWPQPPQPPLGFWGPGDPRPTNPIYLPGYPGGRPPYGPGGPGVQPPTTGVTVWPVAIYTIAVPADQAPPFPGIAAPPAPPATATPKTVPAAPTKK